VNPDKNLEALSQSPNAPFNISLLSIQYMDRNFYASGQVAKRGDGMLATGLVGKDVDMKLAQECAWQCAVNLLESIKKEIGSLDRIEYVVRLGVYVSSADGFTDQHLVAHGASQVILNVFGEERGKHTRTAIGVKSLPLNSPVEVDAIFRIK
jgi:enamine deaminase RidA (YjgF/YER057c/UK114 family)